MKLIPDKNYIVTITIISLILSLLPHIKTLVYRGDAIYLISDQSPQSKKPDANHQNIRYVEVPEHIYRQITKDSTIVDRPARMLSDNESRSYLMEMGSIKEISVQLTISFLFIFLLFIINYPIVRPGNKFQKLNFKIIVSVIAINLGVAYVISLGLNYLLNEILPDTPTLIRQSIHPFTSSSLLALVGIFFARQNYQKQQVQLDNEKLKLEGLQSQFESLKNQVSPHFLFNSLNALQSLIREAPLTAHKYVNHLSSVLRYTLQSTEKETVILDDELKFTQSYIFLLEMRYGSNLIIRSNIKDSFLKYKIPPLTVQTLIENAVKHNEISTRNPLTVLITIDSTGQLIVINNIQKKLTSESGTGIGLSNLMKRYQFLTNKTIGIKRDDMNFTVEVPLIKP